MIGFRIAAATAGAVVVAGACAQPPATDPAAPVTTTTTTTTAAPAAPATPAAPADTSPTDPASTAPSDTDQTDTAPSDTDQTDTAPSDTAPSDTDPASTAPSDTTPADTDQADTAPSDTDQADIAGAGEAAPVGAAGLERSGWSIQVGTEQADTTFGVAAAPDGDVVVAAATEGSLAGDHQGQRDVYLARYSPSGQLRWAVQTGGPHNDSPLGVSAAPDGSVYVGGFTEGDFAATNQGSADVWLARFDPDGNELWRRQFGGPGWDRGFDVTAFDGGAYITGYTASTLHPDTDRGGFDGFAARFDADGNRQWVRHIGTDATDWGQGSALAPDGGLYLTGYTEGGLGGAHAGDKDLFAARISPDGSLAWVTQLGTPALDWTQGVGTGPDGGMLMAGATEGAFAADPSGERDMIVVSLDADGDERWRWQAGTEGTDAAFEVRQSGEFIVVTGTTAGSLAGPGAGLGQRDAVLVWLDLAGNLMKVDQFGTRAADDATGLDVAADGSVVWSGYTFGSFEGAGAGQADLMLGRLTLGR